MPVNTFGGGGVMTGGAGRTYQQTGQAPPPKPGYMYDPNTGRQIPIAGSGQDILDQRRRQQQNEDQARAITFSRTEADRSARDALRSRLMGMLDRPTETSAYSGSGYGGGGGGGGGGAPMPANIGTIALPDTSNAQANIFARAKDKVGQETAGSLASLRSALAGRGMLGGGAEVRGAQNILTAGQGQLGDTTREQAVQEGNRLTDFAKMGYEGAISQRGQDITARGQDIGLQESAQDRALRASEMAADRNTRKYDSVNQLLGKLY